MNQELTISESVKNKSCKGIVGANGLLQKELAMSTSNSSKSSAKVEGRAFRFCENGIYLVDDNNKRVRIGDPIMVTAFACGRSWHNSGRGAYGNQISRSSRQEEKHGRPGIDADRARGRIH